MVSFAPAKFQALQQPQQGTLANRLALAQVAQTPIQPLQLQQPRSGVELAGNLAQTFSNQIQQRRKVEAQEKLREERKGQLVQFIADRQGGDAGTIQSLNSLPVETLNALAAGVAQRQFLPEAPDRTSLERNAMAATGQPLNHPDTQALIRQNLTRPTGTNVSVTTNIPRGRAPAGFQYVRDSEGNLVLDDQNRAQLVPSPGGPVEQEMAAAEEQAAARQQQTERTSDLVTQDIRRALSLIDEGALGTTGPLNPVARQIPASDADQLQGLLNTVRANVGFDRLQQMRENSPTGGALGQVSDSERAALEATMGDLEASRGADQLRFNLIRLNNLMLDTVHGPGNGPPRMELPRVNEGRGQMGRAQTGRTQQRTEPEEVLELEFDENGNLRFRQ
ncbi:MAG: hypothetical protein QNJ62_05205 [Methyloceanibacter sp.]|nr:hypothetical protein [Methyloceanibacter sp.]